jgi:hypothetical protein
MIFNKNLKYITTNVGGYQNLEALKFLKNLEVRCCRTHSAHACTRAALAYQSMKTNYISSFVYSTHNQLVTNFYLHVVLTCKSTYVAYSNWLMDKYPKL